MPEESSLQRMKQVQDEAGSGRIFADGQQIIALRLKTVWKYDLDVFFDVFQSKSRVNVG